MNNYDRTEDRHDINVGRINSHDIKHESASPEPLILALVIVAAMGVIGVIALIALITRGSSEPTADGRSGEDNSTSDSQPSDETATRATASQEELATTDNDVDASPASPSLTTTSASSSTKPGLTNEMVELLRVRGLTWSPDGSLLASTTRTMLTVWDIASTLELDQPQSTEIEPAMEIPLDRGGPADWAPDGTMLAVSTGGAVVILDGLTFEPKLEIPCPGCHIGWTSDSKWFLTGNNKGVKVWDIAGPISASLPAETYQGVNISLLLNGIVAFDDDRFIVSACEISVICVWDRDNPRSDPVRLEGHADRIELITVTPAGDRIVSGSLDRSLRFWNPSTGEQVEPVFARPFRLNTSFLEWSHDLRHLAASGSSTNLREWTTDPWVETETNLGHGGTLISSIEWSPTANLLASGAFDGSLHIWDFDSTANAPLIVLVAPPTDL